MDLELTAKVVLVTGGSKGIGLACARAFLREGATVAIASRDGMNLAAAQQALGASVTVVEADLADPKQALRMADEVVQRAGPIDVLVNSAGAARRTPPEELTPEHWHAAMHAKYFPYVHAMQAVLPAMARRGSGAIVNIVGAGGKVATPSHLPGGAANAALMLATAGLAHAHAGKGVRMNVVNPGLTLTDRLQEGFAADARMLGKDVAEVERQAVSRLPLGRFARPEEVADVVVFLASARASYVTGAVVALDGAVHPIVV